MDGIVAQNGQLITAEMIEEWEAALDRDEWPDGWVNVGEIYSNGRLPSTMTKTCTLSLKVPISMKKTLDREAKEAGQSTGAFTRGLIADGLMALG